MAIGPTRPDDVGMTKILVFLSLALLACGGSSATPSDAGTNTDAAHAGDAAVAGNCAMIASSYTLMAGASTCTSTSGLWSAFTADTTKKTYQGVCNQAESTLYKSQADFDANEGTSGAAGVTVVSHEDYVRTATCASGSIDYTASPDPKTTILFVWTKAL